MDQVTGKIYTSTVYSKILSDLVVRVKRAVTKIIRQNKVTMMMMMKMIHLQTV